MGVKCFMVRPAGYVKHYLRRYQSINDPNDKCAGKMTYHDAKGPYLGNLPARVEDAHWKHERPNTPHDDPRWPTNCDSCGKRFTEADAYQDFFESVYLDDAGKEYTLRDPVPGMMWDAFWCHGSPVHCGPDGRSIHVICPDGSQWCIDSRASNCTMPQDNVHKCWIRHGEPPNLTVDKNGQTCSAGAGSIAVPGYHGFLQNGEFT